MTENPTYHLSSLTDEQWDRQLASQEKMRLAELETNKEIELEKLHNAREVRRARHSLVGGILIGAALLAFALAVIGSMYFGLQHSDERNNRLAVECVQSGGKWIGEDTRDPARCDRP